MDGAGADVEGEIGEAELLVTCLATGRLGGRLIGALASIGFTLLLALLVWEGANTAIQRHLSRLARDAQVARSARVRTLVPILRTTLLITISVIAALVELGWMEDGRGPDILAGTSIGAINAAALASGLSVSQLRAAWLRMHTEDVHRLSADLPAVVRPLVRFSLVPDVRPGLPG